MHIPLISNANAHTLHRRKGGGGGGRGGGGGSRGGSKSSSSKSKSSSSSKSKSGGYSWKPKSSSSGGRPRLNVPVAIPAGRAFEGRKEGGGTRAGIYGTSVYGSGYPSTYAPATQTGTAGLGFPYFFWPIAWAGAGSVYLAHDSRYVTEYGPPSNGTRPGGPLVFASYPSTTSTNTSPANPMFRIMADNGTMIDLVYYISQKCNGIIPTDKMKPGLIPYDGPPPHPDEAIQYYRASTIVLTFSAYNSSANGSFVPPPNLIDTKILDCLNKTIGENAPLTDGAMTLGVGWMWLVILLGFFAQKLY